MEGTLSKIKPPNSHLSNPIHKEAMKLGEQKKRSRSLSPLLPPQVLQPPPPHDITQVCLFGSINGWICGTNPLKTWPRQESLAQCAPPERRWLAPLSQKWSSWLSQWGWAKGTLFFTNLLATFHHAFAQWFQGICYRPYDSANSHPGGKHKGGEGEGVLLRRSAKGRIRDAQECIKVDIFGTRLRMQGL